MIVSVRHINAMKMSKCFFSSYIYIYIYYHRYIIKQLLHYIWILFTHIYLKTKQILVNKIQYSDQLYIILVITLSYLQIPLKTSLISIRSEYWNTWWTLNMVKTWVAKNCIKSHYLLLKQHRFPVVIVFPGFDTRNRYFLICVYCKSFKDYLVIYTYLYDIACCL